MIVYSSSKEAEREGKVKRGEREKGKGSLLVI
jgi:hypothetical protein